MSVSPLPQFAGSTVAFIGGVYRAYGVRAIDGDTIDIIVDVGFEDYRTERVCLAGINTPEITSSDPAIRAKAIEAKQFTATAIEGKVFVVRTSKVSAPREKYGRYLADVYIVDKSLAQLLIEAGLGVPYL